MTPYYDDPVAGVTIYHGDCREVLPTLDLAGVSCVVTDPPYGETPLAWDTWPDSWPTVLTEHLPAEASLWTFGSLRMLLAHYGEFTSAGWKVAQDVVWEKHNGSGPATTGRFNRVHELAVQFYRGQWGNIYAETPQTFDATARTMTKRGKTPHQGARAQSPYATLEGGPRVARSVLHERSENGSALHPTQKPTTVLVPIVRSSAPPGGTVLDPFMGSGSTLVAARQEGRRAIGIEADERYCEVAVGRLAQRTMFVPE